MNRNYLEDPLFWYAMQVEYWTCLIIFIQHAQANTIMSLYSNSYFIISLFKKTLNLPVYIMKKDKILVKWYSFKNRYRQINSISNSLRWQENEQPLIEF